MGIVRFSSSCCPVRAGYRLVRMTLVSVKRISPRSSEAPSSSIAAWDFDSEGPDAGPWTDEAHEPDSPQHGQGSSRWLQIPNTLSYRPGPPTSVPAGPKSQQSPRPDGLRVGGCRPPSTHPKSRSSHADVQPPAKWATITGVAPLPCTLNLGRASGGENVTMQKWTKPVLVKLDIAETLRGSGPCPDGDGGSEAM